MQIKPISALAALILLAFSLAASAQQPAKVGDLLDKGGKKLMKDEVAKLVTGATLKGVSLSSPDFKTETTIKADGTLSGTALRLYGSGTGTYTGKWSLNDQGQLCSDTINSNNQRNQGCGFLFSLGNAYYTSLTDDRTATVLLREVSR